MSYKEKHKGRPTTKRIEPKIVVRAIIYSGSETRMLHVVDVPDPDKYAAHCFKIPSLSLPFMCCCNL
jgi:hypothetical protein